MYTAIWETALLFDACSVREADAAQRSRIGAKQFALSSQEDGRLPKFARCFTQPVSYRTQFPTLLAQM
jgi:hypothetical protein